MLRRRVRALSIVALVAFSTAPLACSLFLDNQDQQCQKDADCSAFPGATCDTATHLCVGATSSGTAGGGSCTGDAGCYACAPKTTQEFLNACTTAQCEPFDRKRLTHLLPDGGLPPLP
jgi:hypothetical protein